MKLTILVTIRDCAVHSTPRWDDEGSSYCIPRVYVPYDVSPRFLKRSYLRARFWRTSTSSKELRACRSRRSKFYRLVRPERASIPSAISACSSFSCRGLRRCFCHRRVVTVQNKRIFWSYLQEWTTHQSGQYSGAPTAVSLPRYVDLGAVRSRRSSSYPSPPIPRLGQIHR